MWIWSLLGKPNELKQGLKWTFAGQANIRYQVSTILMLLINLILRNFQFIILFVIFGRLYLLNSPSSVVTILHTRGKTILTCMDRSEWCLAKLRSSKRLSHIPVVRQCWHAYVGKIWSKYIAWFKSFEHFYLLLMDGQMVERTNGRNDGQTRQTDRQTHIVIIVHTGGQCSLSDKTACL